VGAALKTTHTVKSTQVAIRARNGIVPINAIAELFGGLEGGFKAIIEIDTSRRMG
jgi:hypothetical protein